MECGEKVAVLPMRRRAALQYDLLKGRLAEILPRAMRTNDIDMWLILCHEDNPDPVHRTLIPMDCWTPILQILAFVDEGPGKPVRGVNISGTNTKDLYERPYRGQDRETQWRLLRELVTTVRPRRIGINIGTVQWAAGGLTKVLYDRLLEALPHECHECLTSAEAACTLWLECFTDRELEVYAHVVRTGRELVRECLTAPVVVPGVTTTEDLCWHYWQRAADLGIDVSFRPYFQRYRLPGSAADAEDPAIQQGDLIHCDVGIRYLGMCTDHQEWAYVRRPGEAGAPGCFQAMLAACNELQDLFMACLSVPGATGNEYLQRILAAAERAGIPGARVYSHSLGHLAHEPGPLIGLPWEQERCPGRGDVRLVPGSCFAMELGVCMPATCRGGDDVFFGVEQDVAVTESGSCRLLAGRQEAFHLV